MSLNTLVVQQCVTECRRFTKCRINQQLKERISVVFGTFEHCKAYQIIAIVQQSRCVALILNFGALKFPLIFHEVYLMKIGILDIFQFLTPKMGLFTKILIAMK